MSDENVQTDKEKKPDASELVSSVKADMDKKFEALNATLKQTQEALKQTLATSTTVTNPASAAAKKSFREKFYEDEDTAVNELANEIENRTLAKVQKMGEENLVLQDLTANYPELGDPHSDLRKRALEIFAGLPKADRPTAYKAAVLQAASEMDMVPVTKRKSDTVDSFTGSTGRGTSTGKKTDELDPRTVDFAKKMGLDTADPKVIERLKMRSKRTDWGKFQ